MSKLKELEEMLSKGKISRREFLIRSSALGLTAALSPALLGTPAHAQTPKKGGRLRQGLGECSTTDSLDPAVIPAAMPRNIDWQVRNNLVEIDHKGNAIPELAESWEATPDAAKWTFKLRKGVQFHNGKSLEAEDVIFSVNHHREKDSKSAIKGIVEQIKEMKADGKQTVIFTLEGGNADFPYILADYHLPIVPTGTAGAEWEKGIGTGGYILVSFEPGVRALTRRNPNYWKEGCAHFDEVETIGITDVTARTNALMTGQIDCMNQCDLKTVHLLKAKPDIQVIQVTAARHYTTAMLCDIPPYNNNDVRMALKHAIDREQILKAILRGYGSLGNDQPIGPSYRFHATPSELPQRKFDPDKAKFYLRKAGMEGHVFKLHAADAAFAGAVDTAVLYSEQAAKAGIKIEVVREPDDGYWSNVWIKKEWCMVYWNGRATEDGMFSISYAADSNWNDTHWKNEPFNKLLKTARAELNDAKRREMYVEMQRIASDDSGNIIPMFADIVDAASTKLKFGPIGAQFELDSSRNTERWWFA